MQIDVSIHDGALPAGSPLGNSAGAGAYLVFEGLIRPIEAGRPIVALDYEVYEPMTQHVLRQLAEELAEEHGLIAIRVQHSRGRVEVGACSFRLSITAPHRQEALAAMARYIDRMKQDAPIWKQPVWTEDQECRVGRAQRAPPEIL